MRFRHLSHLPSSGSTNRMVKTDKVCRSEKVSWCQSESSSEYALIVSSSRSERCLVSVFYHLLLDGSTTPDLTNTCLPKKNKQRHFFIRQKNYRLRPVPALPVPNSERAFKSWSRPRSKWLLQMAIGILKIPQILRLGPPWWKVCFFSGGRKKSVVFFWRRIASFVGIITNPSYQFIRPCIGVVITPVITSGGPSCEGFEHFQFFNFVVVILVGTTVAVKECWDLACNWNRFGWTPWKNEQWISTDDFIKGDHQCTSFSCCGVWTFPSTILKTSMREFLTVTASWPSTPELVSSHDFRNFMELLDMSHPNHPFIYVHLYREFILPTNPGDPCVTQSELGCFESACTQRPCWTVKFQPTRNL